MDYLSLKYIDNLTFKHKGVTTEIEGGELCLDSAKCFEEFLAEKNK